MTADHRSREPKRRSEMDAPIGERVQNVEAPAPAHAVFFPARRGRRWRQRLIADQPRLPRHVQHARRMHKARRDGGWLDKALRGGSRILVTLKCNRCLQGARVQSVQPQVRAAAITAGDMDRQRLPAYPPVWQSSDAVLLPTCRFFGGMVVQTPPPTISCAIAARGSRYSP